MRVERVSRALGARVLDVGLGNPLDEQTFADVRQALNEHSVLVFPGQSVEPPAQIRLSGRFGELMRRTTISGTAPRR